eukprot:1529994-Prorocentrum_lima.AAC.1
MLSSAQAVFAEQAEAKTHIGDVLSSWPKARRLVDMLLYLKKANTTMVCNGFSVETSEAGF